MYFSVENILCFIQSLFLKWKILFSDLKYRYPTTYFSELLFTMQSLRCCPRLTGSTPQHFILSRRHLAQATSTRCQHFFSESLETIFCSRKKFSNFFFKFTGDMPFRAQMTNIYSFFSYLQIYPHFLAKNCTSLLGRDCVTPSSINFSYSSKIGSYK